MRILFFIDTNLHVGAGIERTLLNYVKFLKKDNITVLQSESYTVSRIEMLEDILPNNVELKYFRNYAHKFGFLRKNKIGFLIYRLLAPLIIRMTGFLNRNTLSEMRKSEFDIIYLFKNEYWPLFKGRVIIGSNHAEFSSYRFTTRIFAKLIKSRLVYRRINAYHLFPKAAELGSMFERPFFITPIGVDTDLFVPSYRFDKNLNVLFVARLEYIKGTDVLLNIVKECSGNLNIIFHVAGTGFYSEQLRNSVFPNLRYYGSMSDKDLRELYSKCDVFLYPARWDAFPSVIIEALSSGQYILASDFLRGTFDDLVNNGFMEYVRNEPDAFYSRLIDISHKVNEIRMRSIDAHAYAAAHYDNKAVIEAIRSNFINLLHYKFE